MNTPTLTPTPRTDAAWSATFDGQQMSAGKTARTLREHSQQLEAELAAVASALTTLTCTHHNDQQRAACPVCLVATLTAERDSLRADLAAATTDRARMDWLESPAGYDWLWHSAHSVIVRRAEIDAAMKEGSAK